MPAGERAKEQTVISQPLVFRPRPWIISCLTLAADQATKSLLVSSFAPGHSLPLLPPVLRLTYVQNTGAAFGLLKGQQALFVLCSLLVIGWIIRAFVSRTAVPSVTEWGYALMLGGAVGNLIDRARLGYVIDFLDFRVWPVFNVGDSAITIGVTLVICHTLFSKR